MLEQPTLKIYGLPLSSAILESPKPLIGIFHFHAAPDLIVICVDNMWTTWHSSIYSGLQNRSLRTQREHFSWALITWTKIRGIN